MDSIRRTLVQTLIILMMLLGLNLVFADNQVRADQAAATRSKPPARMQASF